MPARRRASAGVSASVALHLAVATVAACIARPRAANPPVQPKHAIERLVFLSRMPPPDPDAVAPISSAAVTLEVSAPLTHAPTHAPASAQDPDVVPSPAEAPPPDLVKPLIATALDHLIGESAPLAATHVDETTREARVVRTRGVEPAGFASAAPAARETPAIRTDQVRLAGFDIAPPTAPAAAPVTPRPKSIDTPVEIVVKPKPAYSDEARTLRLEGTVTLDVEFSSSGQVRVLRVVQGLGHGLDEAAARAAERMRFRPAQSGGRDVDCRATVYITFRLS